ncbi:hypothetical protein B7463_g8311, partial [Scytalidium lignicola]
MFKDSLFSSRSIETVHALLILCIWLCPLSSLSEEPSHIYSGLATQTSLQLGLHRPMQAYSHINDTSDPSAYSITKVKLTTWLACFLVGQMQASSLGVLPPTTLDPQLLDAFDNPTVELHLSQLCRIHYLLGQASLSLRSDGPIPSGLLDPSARLDVIKLRGKDFDTLRDRYLSNMSDGEDYFLKLLRSPYKLQVEVLQDHIERVCQALTTCSPDDINYKASQALQTLPYLEDKKLSPPIVSRMEASVFYDLLRIWVENNFVRTKAADQETQVPDLNSFDWAFKTSS